MNQFGSVAPRSGTGPRPICLAPATSHSTHSPTRTSLVVSGGVVDIRGAAWAADRRTAQRGAFRRAGFGSTTSSTTSRAPRRHGKSAQPRNVPLDDDMTFMAPPHFGHSGRPAAFSCRRGFTARIRFGYKNVGRRKSDTSCSRTTTARLRATFTTRPRPPTSASPAGLERDNTTRSNRPPFNTHNPTNRF